MTDISVRCEQSFYKELYHFGSGKCSLVIDTVSERLWLKKKLSVYDTAVFQYLKEYPHRNIPRIHNYYIENSRLVVIEELISGDTLDYLLENQLLSDEQKTDILLQICDGLIFLHSAQPPIIHRDLKASNILVTGDGVVKIIDYDAAKTLKPEQNKDTILIGTAGSAAPEQYGFGKCDERTDIYSLGVLIEKMFPDNPGLQRVAQKAMRLEPEHRYQHVRQLKNAVPGACGRGAHISFGDIFMRIPGFRSGKPLRMVLSLAGYFILFSYALTFQLSPPKEKLAGFELWCNRICILGIEISLVALFSSGSRPYLKLPFFRNHERLRMAVFYVTAAAVIILFWGIICSVAVSAMSAAL